MQDDFLAPDGAELELEARRKRCAGGRPRTNGAGYRVRKLECMSCGFICRTSRGALERSSMPLCGCGAGALVDVSELEAEHAEARELERIDMRALRGAERDANYGFATGAASCGVCGRFKSRPADRCDHCGDEPSTYGATDAETRAAERVHNRGAGYAF